MKAISNKTLNLRWLVTCSLLIASIYILRFNNQSPGKLLRHATRNLQAASTPASRVCEDIDPNNAFTPAQRERADSIEKSLKTLRGGNPLQTFISSGKSTGDFVSDYGVKLIPYVAIWMVFFVFGFIGMLFCCINLCCMNCACCACCTKTRLCRCCGKPKTEGKCKTYYLYSSIFLSILVLGFSCVGAVVARGVSPNVNKLTCALMSTLQTVQDGSSGDNWIGITPAGTSIDSILTKFDNVVANLNTVGTNYTPMDTKYGETITAINNMYTAGSGSTVTRPDPEQATTTYAPEIITKLGPSSTSGTLTNALIEEMDIKSKKIKDATTDMNTQITDIKAQSATIKSSIESGKTQANDLKEKVASVQDSGENTSKNIKNFSTLGTYGLMAIFAPTLITSFFGVYSTLQVTSLGRKGCNKCVHCSWMCMVFAKSLGLMLTTILFPLSLVLMEFCNVTVDYFGDADFFNKTMNNIIKSDGKVNEMTYICIHGDGDMVEYLGLKNELNKFDIIFDALNKTGELLSSSNVPDSFVIPEIEALFTSTKNGKTVDGPESVADLVKLNSLTVDTTNTCASGVKDNWILNDVNCTQTTKFAGGDTDTTHLGSDVCMPMEIWRANGNTIANRYTATQYGSCPNVNAMAQHLYLQSFVNRFVTNRNEINTLVTTLEGSLNTVKTKHTEYVDEVNKLADPLTPINTTVNVIYDDISNPQSGLFANGKCTFVGSSVRNVFDALCVGLVSNLYSTSLSLGLASATSFFAVFSLFCLAKRSIVEFDSKNKGESEDPDDPENQKMNQEEGEASSPDGKGKDENPGAASSPQKVDYD